MKYTFSGGGGWRQWRQLAAATTLLGSGLLAATGAQAISPSSPPAGQSIANQAAVSYKDNNGSIQTTTSNTVVTTISQVGSYAVAPGSTSGTTPSTPTPGNGKSAGAGATVYSPYTITNNGNGADDFTFNVTGTIAAANFTKIALYEDDGTGQPASTTPLCSFTTGTSCSTAPTKTVAAGATYKFLVAYTLPATATMGSWGSSNASKATVTVSPAKPAIGYAQYDGSTNTSATEARTDTITLTTDAAFSVGKAIKAPAVAVPTGFSALLTNSGSTITTWPVNTSGLASTGSLSQYTTFTLAYANNGAAQRNLYIQDTLPSGFTYVTGTAVSSCSGGTALEETQANIVTCNGGTIDFKQSGQSVKALIPNVQAGASGTLSFVVKIATTATVGVGSTTNTADFTPTGALTSGNADATTVALTANTSTLSTTNSAAYTVMANRGVVMGPSSATAITAKDGTAGTPNSSSDTATISSMAAGSSKMVEVDVFNTGTADDTFNISISSAGNFPTGTVFTWFNSDKLTPLLDTNSDGTVDTGVVAATATKKLYVQVSLPSTTALSATANYAATALAQSVNDTTQKDATSVAVTAVNGGLVDLTNTATYPASLVAGDWGPGPGTSPVYEVKTPSVVAGTVAQIPLYITNNDGASTTYTLAAGSNSAMSPLPAGWSVKFSDSVCSSAVSGPTLTVNANTTSPVIYACVTTPTNETTRTQAIYIQVTSSADSAIKDTLYDAVSVTSQTGYAMQLVANGTGTVTKGNSVLYSHTLTNTGANTCGATTGYLKVDVALDNTSTANGWTSAVYLDDNKNGVLDSGDTAITDGKLFTQGLSSGSQVLFLVRLYAPGGANAGDVATATVTVKDVDSTGATVRSSPSGCGQQTVTDSTTVTSGNFQVVKSHATQAYSGSACPAATGSYTQAAQVAKPGDCVYYQVVATNIGATPQSNVSISDAAPNYTTLQTSPAAGCTSTTLTSGTVAAGGTSPIVTCGGTNVLPPGGSVTLTYVVRINQ
jgi:trimeric autotransporter adhesin